MRNEIRERKREKAREREKSDKRYKILIRTKRINAENKSGPRSGDITYF